MREDALCRRYQAGEATVGELTELWEAVRGYARESARAAMCQGLAGRMEWDDLAEDTMLRAVSSLGTYRREAGTLRTWVAAVFRSVLGDHRRRQAREMSALRELLRRMDP